jgi:hypothetical protein
VNTAFDNHQHMGGNRSGVRRSAKNERLRRRARELVKAGILTPGEAAKNAGVSIALMHAWTKDIDWRAARAKRAKKLWRNDKKVLTRFKL